MNITDDVLPAPAGHPTPVEVSAEGIEVTGGGLRAWLDAVPTPLRP